MINRIKVLLDDAEYDALWQLSKIELRPVADQARFILRAEFMRRGLLPANPPTTPVGGDEPREVEP